MKTTARHPLAALLMAATFVGCEQDALLGPSGDAAEEELTALLSSAAVDGPVADTDAETASRDTDGRRDRRDGRSVFDKIAGQLDGFGGLYRVDHCAVAVVLTDLAEAAQAIEVVKEVVEPVVARGCPTGIRVEAVAGTYTYHQLLRIRSAIRPLHQLRGVVGAKIDFEINKVVVGVASRAVVDSVRQAIVRLGLPADAVGIEVVEGAGRAGR